MVPESTCYGILMSLLCWLLLVRSAGSVVLAAKEDMVSGKVNGDVAVCFQYLIQTGQIPDQLCWV